MAYNINLVTKNRYVINKLSKDELEDLQKFGERQNKKWTAKMYISHVLKFCEWCDVTPHQLIRYQRFRELQEKVKETMSMEDAQKFEFLRKQIKKQVEDLAEKYIEAFKVRNGEHINGKTLAPKTLNARLCAVKAWLLFKGVISNTKEFRQIKFDKSSRATRDKALITAEQFKRMFDAADLREKCVIALYGLHGLRPSLIPQLLIEDLKNPKDAYTPLFINGIPNKIELEEYQWIMVKKEYEGNKGNIDFPVILTSESAEWLTQHLNQRTMNGEKLTLKSKILDVSSKRTVDYITKKLFKIVGFKGRPYLLRHYANKRLKTAIEDKEFKEWCMGHKGKISAIYDHEHGLNTEEIEEYNSSIDMSKLRIYGATTEEMKDAKLMAKVAEKLSYTNNEQINEALRLLEKGKMDFKEFDRRLTQIINEAQNKAIEKRFAELMENYEHNR